MDCATIRSDVIGDFHEPQGADLAADGLEGKGVQDHAAGENPAQDQSDQPRYASLAHMPPLFVCFYALRRFSRTTFPKVHVREKPRIDCLTDVAPE
jgi:hypothetical protein